MSVNGMILKYCSQYVLLTRRGRVCNVGADGELSRRRRLGVGDGAVAPLRADADPLVLVGQVRPRTAVVVERLDGPADSREVLQAVVGRRVVCVARNLSSGKEVGVMHHS